MLSHTVPKKLLEHFAFDNPITGSKRLWRYQKGRAPYWRAAPKTATRWNGHFADPTNATKEAEIESRLKREFEDPVNEFIDLFAYETFAFAKTHVRLLTGYITMLFHRTRARQAASPSQQERMLDALRALRADEERLSLLAAKQTMDLIPNGLRRMVTKEELLLVIDDAIAEQSMVDAPQRRYVATMETMMSFVDEHMLHGTWQILRAAPDHPFVIGDAPVVTWERTDQNSLAFGQGFARPNVEVLLPVFPTACLHILPLVERTIPVRRPTVDEVNRAQAAFATLHCFSNIRSTELDALLQPWFGKVRLGIEGFNISHLDHAKKFFEILMNQPSLPGSEAR